VTTLPDNQGGTTIGVTSASAEFKFTYGYVGNVDGVTLFDSSVFEARFFSYYGGLGWDDYVSAVSRNDLERLFPPLSTSQYLNFATILELKQFTHFYYDPDVQLRLLLQLDDPPAAADSAPVVSDQLISSSTVGIAVGVSVGLVVVVATIVRPIFGLSWAADAHFPLLAGWPSLVYIDTPLPEER
jgi:hypothetical protein